MSDDNYVRSLNDKGIYTAGQMKAGTLRSDGNASMGGEIEMDVVRIAGTACPKTGNIARDAAGAPLSCQDGVWAKQSNALCLSSAFPGGIGMTRCTVLSYKGGLLTGICADQNPLHDPWKTARPYTWMAIDVPVSESYVIPCE